MQEHRERLRLVQQHAQKQQQRAAAKRKLQYDKRAHVERLVVGDIVLLRDHPLGRNKIQDAWKQSRVRLVPDEDGAPVVIEPVIGGDLKRVHRNELKKCKAPVPAPRRQQVELPRFVE